MADGPPGRQQAASDGGEGGKQHGVKSDPPVERKVQANGKRHGQLQLFDGRGHRLAQHQPEGHARQREQSSLHQELLHQAAASRAERKPDGQLLPAGRAARQQQAGDVDAGDRQHQPDHHQQHREEQAYGLHLGLALDAVKAADGRNLDAFRVTKRFRHGLIETPRDGHQTGSRPTDGHARLQARVQGQDGIVQVTRDEHIGRVAEADQGAIVRRQNPDDHVGPPVQTNRAAHHRRIAVQTGAPEMVAQHRHFIGILGQDAAAIGHRNAEGGKVVLGERHREDLACLRAVVPVDVSLLVLAHHVLKQAAGAYELDDFLLGVAVAAHSDGHHRAGVGDGRLAEQELHGHGEDAGVDTDAQA